MNTKYTPSFKIQAIEKVLNRPHGTTLNEIVEVLGVSRSALGKWVSDARKDTLAEDNLLGSQAMKKEKRPQDRSPEERLEIVMACASLNEEEESEYCRKQGVYPHHVDQWRLDFASGSSSSAKAHARQEIKTLKDENRALKKELRRKDKALAETAALLVLQKKVRAIWGNDEDDSP